MPDPLRPSGVAKLPFHYGWVIVGAGTLTIFACLGLGRFALGMLLPSMGEGLGLNYAQMGFISTGNFLGYLAAVMIAAPLAGRFGSRMVVIAGLLAVGVSMMAMGLAGGFVAALVLYVGTGMGSGLANVPLMGLVSHWFAKSLRGRAAGWMVIGSGFAIVFAGHLVPIINQSAGAEGWRMSWGVLGGVALAAALVAGILLRDSPYAMGLKPLGGMIDAPPPEATPPSMRRGILVRLGTIYLLFGATYSIYVTFIVTTLVQERGFSEASAGSFWAWVGGLSLLSGPIFGGLSDRVGRKGGMMVVLFLQTIAYGLVAFQLPEYFLYLSIGMFGIAAWSIPSIMAAAVGDYLGPGMAAKAFGTITVFLGVGQVAGPGLAGLLAEAAGGFAPAYLLAASGTLLAMFVAAGLKPGERTG